MEMRKRLAIILPELLPVPPTDGGAVEQWVQEITRNVPADFEVTVISRPPTKKREPEYIDGINYIPIQWTKLEKLMSGLRSRSRNVPALSYLLKFLVILVYRHRALTAAHGSDVICIQNEPNFLLFTRHKFLARTVLHMHNDHLSFPLLKSVITKPIKSIGKVIFVSEALKSASLRHFPYIRKKSTTILNGADPVKFQPRATDREASSRPPEVLFVGRVDARKGVHILIDAMRIVFAELPQAKLKVVGASFFKDSHLSEYQKALADSCRDISANIEFTGYVDHGEMPAVYANATVMVVPSIFQDPCPLTVLEAMASGCALVASRVGGIPELIDGESGVLVPPEDPTKLAEEILKLLRDHARRLKLGTAARQRVIQQLNWTRVRQEFYQAMRL